MVPALAKVIDILRRVRDTLRHLRHLRMRAAVRHVNEIVRGWVNYFRVGNSGDALPKVRNEVERKVRRFAARKSKRPGFGWKRWSRQVVYGAWGLQANHKPDKMTPSR